MEINNYPIIPDLRLFEALKISKEKGRKTTSNLTKQGKISPTKTPTGRFLLSITDAQAIARQVQGSS